MEAQIADIATNTGRLLLDPAVLALPAVGVLALVTGVAARIAEFVEHHRLWRKR